MSTFTITYTFKLSNTCEKQFLLKIDEQSLKLLEPEPIEPPFWSELDFYQCPHCQLSPKAGSHCPIATSLEPVVREFSEIISYETLFLEVKTAERTVTQKTTAQRALSSYMGVIMACSGCPHTAYFRPMARFHLPLASDAETIYRSTSMYLLAQYFRHQEGFEVDFSLSRLDEIYSNMQTVNTFLAERLRKASKADSNVNAVIMLDVFARTIPFVIEDSLEEIRHLFAPYLQQK